MVQTFRTISNFQCWLMVFLARLLNYGSGNPSFATGEAKISDAATTYGFAQCTPDITGDECNRCLRAALDQYDTECLVVK